MLNNRDNEFFFVWLRPLLLQRYADQLKAKTAVEKDVFLFRQVLEQIPIQIEAGDLFAGGVGYPRNQPFPPQVQQDYDANARRHEAWLERKKQQPPTAREQWRDMNLYLKASGNTTGHCLMDYGRVAREGLQSYRRDVEAQLACKDNTPEKQAFLEGALACLDAAVRFAHRYADLALEQAACACGKEKQQLEQIAAMCRKVPENPADTWLEALQSIYLTHILTQLSEPSFTTVSLGNLDRILYPYYRPEEEALYKTAILQLYRQLETHSGRDCSISLGGTDSSGQDVTNPLSYLFLNAKKDFHGRAPVIALNIHKNTPEEFLLEAVDHKLFAMGQPSFYGVPACQAALRRRGCTPEEIAEFAPSGCMEPVIPGAEHRDSWGCEMNMHLPLELAINGGKPLRGTLPQALAVTPPEKIETFEQLMQVYGDYLEALFLILKDFAISDTMTRAENNPALFKSALTKGCLETGKDRGAGAKYHAVVCECHGLVNTGDALAAIDTLVFQKKKYTLSDFVRAAAANYEGYEQLRADIQNCKKYGAGDPQADSYAAKLVKIYYGITRKAWYDNHQFLLSLHSLNHEAVFGTLLHATFDGRLEGQPLAKNAGPTNAQRVNGATLVMLSATHLDQEYLTGGQALDLYFNKSNFQTLQKRQKLAALIRTYCTIGGMELQVNGADVEEMKKAYADPAGYEHILVRMGGHSVRFNELTNNSKLEHIARMEIEDRS